MTLVSALESLKAKGIKRMVGYGPASDIDRYIQNAKDCDRQARDILKSDPDNEWANYHVGHEDDNFIIEANGHFIIATMYESSINPETKFALASYGAGYETEEEMKADFDAWSLKRDAEKIADEMMAQRPGVLPRAGWVLIAMDELKKHREKADAEFMELISQPDA